jgi:hypothetical protein
LYLKYINFSICKTSVHIPVVDAEAHGLLAILGMGEFIDDLNTLSQIPSNSPNKLMEFYFVEGLLCGGIRQPEGNVFIAGRVLAVRLELGDLASLELGNETIILTPEQSNIIDLKQLHGPSF